MSTLKVDTYLTRGGASEIAIDKLKGASSAGSMLVIAEGGTNTTNLQQGLNKAFCSYDFDTDQVRSSFNIGSVTDRGTGSLYGNFTNNMGSATGYTCTSGTTANDPGSMANDDTNRYSLISADTAARYSQNNVVVGTGAVINDEAVQGIIVGDLA